MPISAPRRSNDKTVITMQNSQTGPTLAIPLPHRGGVRVRGDGAVDFLQNLITQDMALLAHQTAIYACLLTPQGKFQYDFFILKQGDRFLLECEGETRAAELAAHLAKFRLRLKLEIEPILFLDVFALHNPGNITPDPAAGIYADPRHPGLGLRSLSRLDGVETGAFDLWDQHRIALGVPDGSRDMVPGQSTLLECRLDQYNAISFEKGCYVGQELTARMHYRGLAKKHLIPVRTIDDSHTLPESGTDILAADGRLIGEMRSGNGPAGLALIKDDMHDRLPEAGLMALAS